LLLCLAVFAEVCFAGEHSGVVAWWSCSEAAGRQTADNSGRGNDVVLREGVAWVKGVSGSGLEFNGKDGYATTVDANDVDFVNGVTLETWIKIKEFPPDGSSTIIRKGRSCVLGIDARGRVSLFVRIEGRDWSVTGPQVLDKEVWIHLAAVYSPSAKSIKLYLNGGEVDSVDLGDLSIMHLFTHYRIDVSHDPLELGGWGSHEPSVVQFFNGSLDEIKIYDRVLTLEEIRKGYSAAGK